MARGGPNRTMPKSWWFALQVVLAGAAVSQQCDKDDAAYIQRKQDIRRRRGEVDNEVQAGSDPCLNTINTGLCDSSCTACVPEKEIVPSTSATRFPLGYLNCSGTGACELNTSMPDWASDYYEFESASDFLTCEAPDLPTEIAALAEVVGACRFWNVGNAGAACCSGSYSCSSSRLGLADGGCTNDICCKGESACQSATYTGVHSLSCKGGSTCWDAIVSLSGDLYCDSSGTDGGACSNDRAAFTFTGPSHCIECYGKRTCALGSEFIYMAEGNLSIKCGEPGADNTGTCAGAQVHLREDTCVHLTCESGTCEELMLIKFDDSSVQCFCEGPGCADLLSAGDIPGGVTCSPVPAENPNPCGTITCSAACCDSAAAPSCSSCCPPPSSGSLTGDPHITTFDGRHYTLLEQGNFLLWSFSGLDTEVPSVKHGMKKVPMDFEILSHYSGRTSFTKALLLVDKSNGLTTPRQVLELTSENCTWRTLAGDSGKWRAAGSEFMKLTDADGDALGAFNVSKPFQNHNDVELLMMTTNGFRKVAQLSIRCQPGYHLAAKVKMPSARDARYAQGELSSHRTPLPKLSGSDSKLGPMGISLVATDREFARTAEWTALGGSMEAATYLKEVDVQGPGTFLKQCSQEEQHDAAKICNKHWGPSAKEDVKHRTFLEDCIYDICAGGGEVAAELTAEIMRDD